ncbi:MAG: hypothetical protein IPN76_29500 [Saprospiraceae bacterium]|nr:hypothetical protein [Saprospiraceae bacterium]
MHFKLNYILLLFSFLIGCQADPNVGSDDDPIIPFPPNDSLICEALPAPNTYFSNAIGEVLIFIDSLSDASDTLVCIENEAWSEVADLGNNGQTCHEFYRTTYRTNWLPKPDLYALEVSISKTLLTRHTAQSVLQQDFISVFTDAGNDLENRYNSLVINGKTFAEVDLYNCNPSSDCAFVEALAIAKNKGLIAFKRKGEWWTRE